MELLPIAQAGLRRSQHWQRARKLHESSCFSHQLSSRFCKLLLIPFLKYFTFLSPAEIDAYASVYARTGFRGGINWYRNFDRNWETAPEVGAKPIDVPSLMLCAAWDQALRPEMAAGMPMLCRDLETVTIERCGHWTQQEHPDELNRILVDWLRRKIAA